MKASKTVRRSVKNASYKRRQSARDDAYAEKKKARVKKLARDAEHEHELKLARIRATERTGVATAASTGATTLGLGLNAENNQDAQITNRALQDQIDAILGKTSTTSVEDDTTGLKTATM